MTTQTDGDLVCAVAGVTKTYRSGAEQLTVVRDVECELRRGDFAVLQGPSGSGKTTLLHLIAGIITPDDLAGSIQLEGVELVGLSENQRRKVRLEHCGLVFQNPMLIQELTVEENVVLPTVTQGGSGRAALRQAKREAGALLEAVGLGDLAQRFPAQLSGGQKTRVAVARALMGDKRFVIADEPTGSLDAKTSREIFDLFLQLTTAQRTVLVATHDHRAADYATVWLTVDEGRVSVERGR
ncbi:ABC transporter ATP-binding protein [Corynebacterium aquilae]|nr:ABC transporter ATP-binding protein [Corynebacterium aquilae]